MFTDWKIRQLKISSFQLTIHWSKLLDSIFFLFFTTTDQIRSSISAYNTPSPSPPSNNHLRTQQRLHPYTSNREGNLIYGRSTSMVAPIAVQIVAAIRKELTSGSSMLPRANAFSISFFFPHPTEKLILSFFKKFT